MPYYRDALASAWPEIISDVGAPPVKFDAQFLGSLKPTDFGLYGRNTRGLRRNQVEHTRDFDKNANAGLKAPKFLSEKARESAQSTAASDEKAEELASPLGDMNVDNKKSEVPVMYRNVEIKYSKFGVDDFDFGYVKTLGSKSLGFALIPFKLLQQNSLFWSRDSYLKCLCQFPTSNHVLYAFVTESGFATHCNSVR